MNKTLFLISFFLTLAFISCEKPLSTTPEYNEGPNIKLVVESDPIGARIFLDGKNTGHTTPDTVQWLEPRNYKLTLKLELFKDTNVVITVNKSGITKVKLDYTRNPNMRGILYCDSNPRGAEVFFGDSSTGKFTPVSIQNLYPGLYNVKFKKEGFWDDTSSIYVESAKTRYATVNLVDSVIWVRFTDKSIKFPSNFLTHIAIESGWIKWASTVSEGIVRFDDKTLKVFNESNSPLPSNSISMVEIDASGKKWICTNNGLAVFDNTSWTIYNSSNSGLPSNLVKCVTFDLDGSAWIGTLNKGLVKFDGANWTVYDKTNSGIGSNSIKSIVVDPGGVKWIGTGDAGVVKFDNGIWRIYNKENTKPPSPPPPATPKPGIPNNNVESITLDPAGIIWIGVGVEGNETGGSSAFRGFGNWTIFTSIPSTEILSVAIDVDNIKWVGNANNGLSKYNGLGWTNNDGSWIHFNTSNSGIGSDRIFSVAIDANGDKWLATYGGGLVKYKGN